MSSPSSIYIFSVYPRTRRATLRGYTKNVPRCLTYFFAFAQIRLKSEQCIVLSFHSALAKLWRNLNDLESQFIALGLRQKLGHNIQHLIRERHILNTEDRLRLHRVGYGR